MTIELLDKMTMWAAFIYGLTLFFIVETPILKRVEPQAPELFALLRKHQPMAFFCLWVGAAWILQTLWV